MKYGFESWNDNGIPRVNMAACNCTTSERKIRKYTHEYVHNMTFFILQYKIQSIKPFSIQSRSSFHWYEYETCNKTCANY